MPDYFIKKYIRLENHVMHSFNYKNKKSQGRELRLKCFFLTTKYIGHNTDCSDTTFSIKLQNN